MWSIKLSFNANNIRNIAYEHCTMYIICNYNSSAIGCSWTPGSLPAFYLLYNSLAPLPLLGQVGEVSQTIRQRFVCTLKLLRLLQSNQQGRIQGGRGDIRHPLTDSGRGVATPWDFEAKNVPNLINRMCFSILSYLIIFYLMEI